MNLPNLMTQLQAALTSAGAPVVLPLCPICNERHGGECPQRDNAGMPFVAILAPRMDGIVDGIAYDGKRKPPMVEADNAGWREI